MTAAAVQLDGPRLYLRGQVDYASIDAVNFSTLKFMAKSPLHYRFACDHATKITQPMRLGDAAHTSTLEPVRFTQDYAVYVPPPPTPKKSKTGKVTVPKAPTDRRGTNAWKEFEVANDGKTVLKEGEFNAAMRIRDAVRSNAEALRYLRKGDAEVTLVWQDAETGVWLKCRLDFLSHSVPDVIAELKSSVDVSPWKFQSQYARMNYHVQAAMQCDGLEAVLGRTPYHKCIAVEATEPHDTAVYNVIGEPLELGREMYRDLLNKLVACRRNNDWPGVAAGAEVELRLPAWATAGQDDLSDLGLEL